MQERAWTYSAILVFRQASCLGFTLLFLKLFSRDYLTLISASVLSIALSSVAGIYFSRSYWFSPWRDVFDKVSLRPLLRFGLPLVPASIMMWVLNGMDKIALRHWGTFQDLGIYSAGFKIVGVLSIVNMAFSTFWAPVSYRWFEAGVSVHRFDKVAKYLALSLTVLAISLTLSRDYIVLLLGPNYQAASDLVPFLMFVPIMYLLSEVTGIGIGFARRSEFHLLASGAAAFSNLIGNWILVPLYGAMGASIATAISYIIFMVLKSVVGSLLWRKNFGQPFVYLMVLIMIGSSVCAWMK
jgi:O-antigen/teichoic acid export membrane protein